MCKAMPLFGAELLVVSVALSIFRPPVPHLVWNATASVPIGLYALSTGAKLRKGELVLVTLPDPVRVLAARRDYLPSGVPLAKPVAAIAGDTICANGSTVRINGKIVAHRLRVDSKGRAMPAWQGCRTLHSGQVFLLAAKVRNSFDSRYFGPVRTSALIGFLRPIWIR